LPVPHFEVEVLVAASPRRLALFFARNFWPRVKFTVASSIAERSTTASIRSTYRVQRKAGLVLFCCQPSADRSPLPELAFFFYSSSPQAKSRSPCTHFMHTSAWCASFRRFHRTHRISVTSSSSVLVLPLRMLRTWSSHRTNDRVQSSVSLE